MGCGPVKISPDELKDFYRPSEIAEMFGVDKCTVHRWIARGVFADPKTGAETVLSTPTNYKRIPLKSFLRLRAMMSGEVI